MKKLFTNKVLACILVAAGMTICLAGNVVVREGTVEGDLFKMSACSAGGTNAVAFGADTNACGNYSTALGALSTASGSASTAMGYDTEASEDYSTAMGRCTTASGARSTAMGYYATASGSTSIAMGLSTTASGSSSTAVGYGTTAGPAARTIAMGKNFTNNVQDSFAVGFGQKDFSVQAGVVTVGDANTFYGNLVVGNIVDANDYTYHSCFYDKDSYGRALDYAQDSSNSIKLNAEGQKEYDHEADPIFLQRWVTVKDYDDYSEENIWNAQLQEFENVRTYKTHRELRSSLSMKVAWLRQCVYELKQENNSLKAELASIKQRLEME